MIHKAKIKSQNLQLQQNKKLNEKRINIDNLKVSVLIKIAEKKITLSNENNLGNYQPSKYLSDCIHNDYIELYNFLSKIEMLNTLLSDLIIKKKINIRDIEIKLKQEELMKEKETFMIKRNLEEKLESVLGKANICLENIKNLGKKNNNPIEINKNIIKNKITHSTISNPSDLSNIIKNLHQKYNDNLTVDKSNMDSYFSLIAKNRKVIKDLKDKSKRQNLKYKEVKDLFSNIYNKNKDIKNEKDELNNSNVIFNSSIYNRLNLKLQALSIINTSLFEKLYIKILYENNFNKKSSEDDIFDIFSFWYILKNIKNILSNKENLNINSTENITSIIKTTIPITNNFIKNKFINRFIISNLKTFYNSLHKVKENELIEEEIFDKYFYNFYDSILKIDKIKYIKNILNNLQEIDIDKTLLKNTSTSNSNLAQKEQLLYLKSIYGLINNNANYTYEISKK